jgi:hypothetical protein
MIVVLYLKDTSMLVYLCGSKDRCFEKINLAKMKLSSNNQWHSQMSSALQHPDNPYSIANARAYLEKRGYDPNMFVLDPQFPTIVLETTVQRPQLYEKSSVNLIVVPKKD